MSTVPSSSDSELVIRTLYEIAGENDIGFEHQVKRILELGLTRFNLEIGILSNIHDTTYTVVHQVSPKNVPLEDGAEFPLGDTYCCLALTADAPIGFEYVGTSSIATHPAYKAFGLEAYIGMPIRVKNQVYGTLNFSSPMPKPRAFTEVDIEALRLMAAWVGSELSRRQTEVELVQAKEMLERQSREDPLAHLYNRRGFEEKLVRPAVSAVEVEAGSSPIKPSVSLGVFEVPFHVESVTDALKISRIPLKQAKDAGKNRVASQIKQEAASTPFRGQATT
jgi:transcriptional regulator with GAF, ATPase, and Fis domain